MSCKPTLTVFPYHKTPEGEIFPIIPLRLWFKDKSADTSALLDSGATTSIFRPEVAEEIGREKVFGNFVIVFDEKKKKVELK